MKKIYKISSHTKRIIVILLAILQFRIAGVVSNVANTKGVKGYKKIVKSFSEILKEEEINDVQHIYEYYNYALWNGYFSENHKLKYNLDRDIYFDNNGMSIMSGNSVCLNYADMLSAIFKEMGFNSYVMCCYVNPSNTKAEKIRTDKDITRKIDENSTSTPIIDNSFVDGISKVFGNHAITCVENNGEVYFFDPTNLIYLEKTGINDVSIINGTGKFDLKYLPSLLFDDVNVFKVITKNNSNDYKNEVLEKQEININVEKLEEFYASQKENIDIVNKSNDKNFNLLSMMIYSLLASAILSTIRYLADDLINKIENKEIKDLFPILKEYFNEKNIKTEFETLKNYELITNTIGIKNNMLKDLFNKAFNILITLVENRKMHHFMLDMLLIRLGYYSYQVPAKKYSSKLSWHKTKLIYFIDKTNKGYYYDYELEELLCKDESNNLRSIDGKYMYKIESKSHKKFDDHLMQEAIKEKMKYENILLSKEELKNFKNEILNLKNNKLVKEDNESKENVLVLK